MKLSTAVLIRALLSLVAGMLIGWLVSEGSYLLNKDPSSRDEARRIELVIPPGTAERVAAGEDVVSMPQKMALVVGDLLVVKNQDSVSHQLGPVWVPPQSSGVLQVGQADNYEYTCSFQTSKLFGIEVRQRLTFETRLQGAMAIGLPTGLMIGLYSFLVVPIKARQNGAQAA